MRTPGARHLNNEALVPCLLPWPWGPGVSKGDWCGVCTSQKQVTGMMHQTADKSAADCMLGPLASNSQQEMRSLPEELPVEPESGQAQPIAVYFTSTQSRYQCGSVRFTSTDIQTCTSRTGYTLLSHTQTRPGASGFIRAFMLKPMGSWLKQANVYKRLNYHAHVTLLAGC